MSKDELKPVQVCEFSMKLACDSISKALNKAADETLDMGMNEIVHTTTRQFTELLMKVIFEEGEEENGE